MYDVAVITPLRLGSSSPTGGWDNHGFLNDAGSNHKGPRNHGDDHIDKG